MNKKQKELLIWRFISAPRKYQGNEPAPTRLINDKSFCSSFFPDGKMDKFLFVSLLTESISKKDELELDLLLMLLEHFDLIKKFDLILAELLIQPWHHFHDRLARMLEFNASEKIIDNLYKGAIYRCDNLEYESDYCEFNRKCLYALAKIGTSESIDCIKDVANSKNTIISNHAKKILHEYMV